MENSPGLELGGVCDRLPDILNLFRLGITPTRVKFMLHVRNVPWRQSSGRIELRIIITENVRTEGQGRTGGTPVASFRRTPVRISAFLKPSM